MHFVKNTSDCNWRQHLCVVLSRCSFYDANIRHLMLCLDFSMNMVSVVGCRLGSSSQSSGSRSEMCCRLPEDSILFELSTCTKKYLCWKSKWNSYQWKDVGQLSQQDKIQRPLLMIRVADPDPDLFGRIRKIFTGSGYYRYFGYVKLY